MVGQVTDRGLTHFSLRPTVVQPARSLSKLGSKSDGNVRRKVAPRPALAYFPQLVFIWAGSRGFCPAFSCMSKAVSSAPVAP